MAQVICEGRQKANSNGEILIFKANQGHDKLIGNEIPLVNLMALNESFFSSAGVSHILGELTETRRNCKSLLGVGEAHYHDAMGKAQPLSNAPKWLIPVYHPRRGTLNCFKDCLDLSKLYEAGWTYIDCQLRVTVYSTVDLCQGDPVDNSLLQHYLPKLQDYGSCVQIFPFNREIINKKNVIYETKHVHGTRAKSVKADEIDDSIPTAWYDFDYKTIIRYSKDLVLI